MDHNRRTSRHSCTTLGLSAGVGYEAADNSARPVFAAVTQRPARCYCLRNHRSNNAAVRDSSSWPLPKLSAPRVARSSLLRGSRSSRWRHAAIRFFCMRLLPPSVPQVPQPADHPYRSLGPTVHSCDMSYSAPNKAAPPNRRPRFALAALCKFDYSFCAPPSSPAAVGEPQRSARAMTT